MKIRSSFVTNSSSSSFLIALKKNLKEMTSTKIVDSLKVILENSYNDDDNGFLKGKVNVTINANDGEIIQSFIENFKESNASWEDTEISDPLTDKQIKEKIIDWDLEEEERDFCKKCINEGFEIREFEISYHDDMANAVIAAADKESDFRIIHSIG